MNIENPITIEKVDMINTLRYLGYGDHTPDDNMQKIIEECEEELLRVVKPNYIYKVFDITKDYNIVDCNFKLEGQDIKKHLYGCEKVVLMCVTLSGEVDRLIRTSQIKGVTNATIIDAMASAMVEQVCDKVEDRIRERFDEQFGFTWRYGLGYGDFPLENQKQFLNVLDATKKIGVAVSPGMMLTPTKSVTCVIGVGRKNIVDSGQRSCSNCNFNDRCQYKTRRSSCGR